MGNTHCYGRLHSCTTVHPHACGEHQSRALGSTCYAGSSPRMWGTPPQLLIILISLGSSPRMWGTHDRRPAEEVGDRFIPTHVGNTNTTITGAHSGRVHPHACGEHSIKRHYFTSMHGSSPRMWGTHYQGDGPPIHVRFIPTHVGNTKFAPVNEPGTPVHPHACGEHCGS